MPGCILTSPDGIERKERIIAIAQSGGSKVLPIISMFCEHHGQHHAVGMEGEAVDRRYGSTPVDVQMTLQEEKADMKFQAREYCGTCMSYHVIGQCRGLRTRESVSI